MKISDIIREDQELVEISMTPSALRQQAAGIDAVAGMEFEIAFPGRNLDDDSDDAELEPDYESDRRTRSIQDIVDFYDDGDVNSTRDLNRLDSNLRAEFSQWASETADSDFSSDKEEIVWDYIKQTYLEDEDDVSLKDRLETALKDRNDDFDNARDEYIEQAITDASEEDFLRYQGIQYLRDVKNLYDIAWPHWTQPDVTNNDAEDIAGSFGDALGVDYNFSSTYHRAARSSTAYSIEPDGSIIPPGLEFISPPQPLDNMLDDLRKVQAWAASEGGDTNESTGLHMNVSITGRNFENLDYVKLALLLGDEYVLNQFGRISNTYADSALSKIRQKIRLEPQSVPGIMMTLSKGLADVASKLIHSGKTNKYTSINVKSGYIEFRSPGGDWLSQDFELLETTLLRFVVALDAALDPEKYRREYLAKLYKLLTPAAKSPQDQDVIELFARTATGELSKQALIRYLQQRAISRVQKKPPVPGQRYEWKVYVGSGGTVLPVLATSETEAKQLAQLMYSPWEKIPQDMLDASPVKVYRPGAMSWYKITNDLGNIFQNVQATSEIEARQKMSLASPDLFGPPRQVEVERMTSP
jgi:hypothetical protein